MTFHVSKTITNETLNRIITIESAGNPRAKARTSSATGLGQFLNATWLATVQRHRPDWMENKTKGEILALRLDPKASIEMLARFTEDNAALIPGEKDADGDIYLAHFAGVGVAKKLFTAPQARPCSDYFSPAAIAANRSILEGKTVGQVRAWAESKMRKAGNKKWIEKFYGIGDDAVRMVAAPDAPTPADADPENEWTYNNPKPEKSGISEVAQVGGGFSILALATTAWEKIKELPESLLTALFELAQKPHFWLAAAMAGGFAYIYIRRRKQKAEEI